MQTLAQIKAAISSAKVELYGEGQRTLRARAKREGLPFVRPRQTWLTSINADTGPLYQEEWDGTLRQINQFVENHAKRLGLSAVLEGGYDAAETIYFDDYEPEFGEMWSVAIYEK